MRILSLITILLISHITLTKALTQDCPSSLYNGDFEHLTNIPGGTPSLGISKGGVENWFATHGTADYQTPEWDWYGGLRMIDSNVGHICYGNRPDHKHSEGIYTQVELLEGKTYTMNFDYGTVCDRPEKGFLHIFLNNSLIPSSHNNFQFPTEENNPDLFTSSMFVEIIELIQTTDLRTNGFDGYKVSFTCDNNYGQVWLFTSFDYTGDDSVNCGFLIDNVTITSKSQELKDVIINERNPLEYEFKPVFDNDINVAEFGWSVNGEIYSDEEIFVHTFDQGNYTVCLDIVDSNSACGNLCKQLTLGGNSAVELCDYNVCLDFGGIPQLTGFEYVDSRGNERRISSEVRGFHFPYCLGSTEFCSSEVNELNIFIADVNLWMQLNGLLGSVSIGDDSAGLSDGCRSKIISVNESEIEFQDLIVEDQAHTEYSNSFERREGYCTSSHYLEEKTQENFVAQEEQSNSKLKDSEQNITINLFPNPFVDSVTLSSQEDLITDIAISNLSGAIVFEEHSVSSSQRNIDLTSLSDGMYIVEISTDVKIETYKIMKN